MEPATASARGVPLTTVAVATWKFPDPTERFVVNKVAGLVDRGFACAVVAEEVVEDVEPAVAGLLRDRVTVSSSFQGLRTADLVHFEHAGVALRHRRLLPQLRAPTVVTCHGSDVRVESIGREWIRNAFAEVFASVDRVHCVSAELAKHCADLGAREEQLYVAPVGVDLELFAPRPTNPRPSELALRLVSVGRLDWVKGYEYALHAVRRLRDNGRRVAYTIVGVDEGAEPAVRLAIRDFGLEAIVTLRGHLTPEGVRDTLAASDVFVLSSVSEGASVATMEAMAMGLPVVVTDVGGMREIVRDGVHGFVVPSRDPAAIETAVAKLCVADVRRHMGQQASADVRRFDASVEIDRLVDLYRDLLHVDVRPTPVDGQLISVVIVARDAADTIEDQLRALSFQAHHGPWEVVVVDNCSSDGMRARVRAWSDRLPNLRVFDAPDRPNIAYARNVGVRAARGARIAMCDADDVVAPGWLDALAHALDDAPLVRGALERSRLLPASVTFGDGVDTGLGLVEGYRPRVLTGNLGFRREVFDAVGGFDESLARGADLDFGWRAIDAGYAPEFVGDAIVHYRSQWRPGAVVRRAFADGRSLAALYVRHCDRGMRRASDDEVRSRYWSLLKSMPVALAPGHARVEWLYDAAHSAGRLAGSVEQRVKFL